MIRLDPATVLLGWAVGGLFFGWVTTRRREVGIGYGWVLRATYLVPTSRDHQTTLDTTSPSHLNGYGEPLLLPLRWPRWAQLRKPPRGDLLHA